MVISLLYYIALILFLIVYTLLSSVVWALTVWWDKKRCVISATSYPQAMMLFWLAPGWKIKIEGAGNYDRKKPHVLICNHQGMLDIPLIHAIRPNIRWVAKRELLKMPFVGHALFIRGDITIKRGDAVSARQMFVKARKVLKRGGGVAVFPEGTRLKSGQMNRFRDGAFRLAKTADVEILPVVLDGTADAFNGWKPVRPHTFRLRVLPAIPVETVRELDPKALADLARETILAEHREMRPDLYREA